MKRKTTELEKKLQENGWYLTLKRYTGKTSEKTYRYEYHKTSDLRNESKTYEQIIELDQKRSQIVNYGIANVQIDYLDSDELMFVRFLFLELRRFVDSLSEQDKVNVPNSEYDERQELGAMTPEQFDELCKENEQ